MCPYEVKEGKFIDTMTKGGYSNQIKLQYKNLFQLKIALQRSKFQPDEKLRSSISVIDAIMSRELLTEKQFIPFTESKSSRSCHCQVHQMQ